MRLPTSQHEFDCAASIARRYVHTRHYVELMLRSHSRGPDHPSRLGPARVGDLLRDRGGVDVLDVSMRNRLKELRSERRWTQADLAKELDVPRQTVNALEGGHYDPSLPLAFTIAKVFGLRIEEIFTPED